MTATKTTPFISDEAWAVIEGTLLPSMNGPVMRSSLEVIARDHKHRRTHPTRTTKLACLQLIKSLTSAMLAYSRLNWEVPVALRQDLDRAERLTAWHKTHRREPTWERTDLAVLSAWERAGGHFGISTQEKRPPRGNSINFFRSVRAAMGGQITEYRAKNIIIRYRNMVRGNGVLQAGPATVHGVGEVRG
jgi:hypothetical protein